MTAELLDRNALLILDNFESVIDQATQAGDLLAAAPRLRLLVTSRVALRLTGEQEVAARAAGSARPGRRPVRGSPVRGCPAVRPTGCGRAVRLLRRRVERRGGRSESAGASTACRSRSSWSPPAPASCRSTSSPAGSGTCSTCRPAPGTCRRASERCGQPSIGVSRSSTARSSGRSPASACFPRPFTAAAAAAVLSAEGTPDVLDLLATLVDHSLLRPSIDSGETRFSMLQTVRDYARSQLDPSETDGRARPARRLLPGAGGQDRRGAARWRAAPGARGAGRRHRQHPARGRVAARRRPAGGGRRRGLGAVAVLLGPGRARRLESLDPGGLGRRRIASGSGAGAAAGRRRLPRHVAAGLRHSPARAAGRRSSSAEQIEDESLVTLVDIALVIVYGGLGDEAGARAAGREALRLARAAADRWSEAYALTGLCFLDVALGRVRRPRGRRSTRCSTRRGPARTRCAWRSRSGTPASSGWPPGTSRRRSS